MLDQLDLAGDAAAEDPRLSEFATEERNLRLR